MSDSVVPRRALGVALQRMRDDPVLLLEGPRSVGKSTLLREMARIRGARLLDLDDLATRDAVLADPGTMIAGDLPVFVDEYQKAPEVLDAIKAELNRGSRPGKFVLTGSTRHDSLPPAAQALTGRLSRLPIFPLSQGEIGRVEEGILSQLLSGETQLGSGPDSYTAREDYVQRVTRGGFPLALAASSDAARRRWIDNYLSLTMERDVYELSRLRQGHLLELLLTRLAAQTAQVLNLERAARDVGIDKTTADSYVRLFEKLFVVQRLPAWGRTVTARSARSPKLHVIDSGIAARLLRLTPSRLSALDPSALTEFGDVLESFAVSELLRQASWSDQVVSFGHWRTYDGDEVDLIIERDDGAIIGFEIKAASRVTGNDFRPLAKLRTALGSRFLAGIALCLGQRSYSFDEKLHVMPLDRLWLPSS